MSIVKMKRLRAVAMGSERDALLTDLQRLGCVQIDRFEGDDLRWAALTAPNSTALDEHRDKVLVFQRALRTLDQYAKAKGGFLTPRPQLTEAALFDEGELTRATAAAQAIRAEEERVAALKREESTLRTKRKSLAPWLELDLPLDTADTPSVLFLFAALSAHAELDGALADLEVGAPLSQVVPAGRDREFQYLLLICHRSEEESAREALRPYGFSRVPLKGWTGTAAENDAALARRLEELAGERAQAVAALTAQAVHREALRLATDRISQEVAREEARGRLLQSESAIFLEGWVPAEKSEALSALLSRFTCAWETEDPVKDDYPQVPIQLKNNPVTRPLTMVTEMYALPAYNGVDPNPLMMPFFVFFFGFMFADLGYGLILAGLSLLVLHKARPKGTMGYMMALMLECGISAAVIGFFTGGFFSDSIATVSGLLGVETPSIPFLTEGALLNVTNDPMTVLLFTLGVGVVQIVVGMAINAYLLLREGNWKDAFFDVAAWWVVFAGLAVLGVAGSAAVLWLGLGLVALGSVVRASFPFERGIFLGLLSGLTSSVVGLLSTLYSNITGYFGDVLSYSRLMVMMLAGSVIGSIFNLLGSMPGNFLIFAVVFVVGHLFNMALNIIGTYVHTSRLQYLEYFGKFYREGGRPFRPLNFTTAYVDIKEET